MTDNEIRGAMYYCRDFDSCNINCPFFNKKLDCVSIISKYAFDFIARQKAEIEKIKKNLQYYLNTNEENGVVYIPKFVVDDLVKEMTEVETNQRKEDEGK